MGGKGDEGHVIATSPSCQAEGRPDATSAEFKYDGEWLDDKGQPTGLRTWTDDKGHTLSEGTIAAATAASFKGGK